MVLLLALAAASVPPRLEAIDRSLAALSSARTSAQAPLATLLGQAERLALQPRTPVRDRRLARTAALIRALTPGVRSAIDRLAAERDMLAQERARLLLGTLRRSVGGRLADAQPIPPPACPRAVWRLPPYAAGVHSALAARLGQTRALTLLALPGFPIPAPAAARVAFAGQFRRYHGTVILDHGHGWTTLVTGLDRLAVATDTHVAQGQTLGQSGTALPLLGVELSRHGRPIAGETLLHRCMG